MDSLQVNVGVPFVFRRDFLELSLFAVVAVQSEDFLGDLRFVDFVNRAVFVAFEFFRKSDEVGHRVLVFVFLFAFGSVFVDVVFFDDFINRFEVGLEVLELLFENADDVIDDFLELDFAFSDSVARLFDVCSDRRQNQLRVDLSVTSCKRHAEVCRNERASFLGVDSDVSALDDVFDVLRNRRVGADFVCFHARDQVRLSQVSGR